MIHDHGYWLSEDDVKVHMWDKSLNHAIMQAYDVSSIVDIGCGDGRYTRFFLDHGIFCVGYDGSPLTPQITQGQCMVRDFSMPVDIGQFDLVLSLEVGEHIPKQYEQTFISNICKASREYLCMSWAVEGQGGTGHVNCQNNIYVINNIEMRGFTFDGVLSANLRNHSTFPWFHNTILCFERNGI